jgi:hypothetical protein
MANWHLRCGQLAPAVRPTGTCGAANWHLRCGQLLAIRSLEVRGLSDPERGTWGTQSFWDVTLPPQNVLLSELF